MAIPEVFAGAIQLRSTVVPLGPLAASVVILFAVVAVVGVEEVVENLFLLFGSNISLAHYMMVVKVQY